MERKCFKCQQVKDITMFPKNKNSPLGYMYICKICSTDRAKEYYKNNLDRCKQYDKERYYKNHQKNIEKNRNYYKNNKDKFLEYYEKDKEKILMLQKEKRLKNPRLSLFKYAKSRAKRKNLEFNIDIDDIIIPEVCPVLGIPLQVNQINNKKYGTASNNSPTIDRIDNNKGYIKGNIRVISYRANVLKNNASIEEMQKILDDIKVVNKKDQIVVVCSGYMNPIHSGHIEYLEMAKKLGDKLIVIINNDAQRVLKGSKEFMNQEERMLIVASLRCVDSVVLSIDTDTTVCKTLELLNPHIFAKGGDRFASEIPEAEVCNRLGITMVDGLGQKIQSSSWLLNKKDE